MDKTSFCCDNCKEFFLHLPGREQTACPLCRSGRLTYYAPDDFKTHIPKHEFLDVSYYDPELSLEDARKGIVEAIDNLKNGHSEPTKLEMQLKECIFHCGLQRLG